MQNHEVKEVMSHAAYLCLFSMMCIIMIALQVTDILCTYQGRSFCDVEVTNVCSGCVEI